MIVTRVHGNVGRTPLPDGVHVERVVLDSADLVKRIQRVSTDHGREIGIRLPPERGDLRDGDILDLTDDNAVVVQVRTSDILIIRARTILEMAITAHTLGNRHLPAQFFGADSGFGGEVMVVAYDHTVADYLTSAGVPFERTEQVMPIPFRHAEHTH